MKTERPYPFVTIDARGSQARPGGPPLGVRQRDHRPGGRPGGRRPLRRAQPQGAVPGHGVPTTPTRKSGCGCSPKTPTTSSTRPSSRRRAQYAWDYRKAVMGPDVACCRRDLWGGRPLPGPDRGPVRGHSGGPDAVPGHGAAQGLDFPRPGCRRWRPAASRSGGCTSATT